MVRKEVSEILDQINDEKDSLVELQEKHKKIEEARKGENAYIIVHKNDAEGDIIWSCIQIPLSKEKLGILLSMLEVDIVNAEKMHEDNIEDLVEKIKKL